MFKQEIDMDIAIQPPAEVQAGSTMYPPVVIRIPPRPPIQNDSSMPEIFQGYLQDDSGNVVEECGPYIASPQPVNTSTSRTSVIGGADSQYVVFPNIIVDAPGTYTFTVRCYDTTNGLQSWTILGAVHTKSFTVADCAVLENKPNETEQRLLEELKASGNFGL
ncbi:uncharacterized protein B0I36DRAFT_78036 [Microdochium trichocladiopsis]|uniref:Uncharacterized protein n=1 Tax=Microdochium trichocladiopsis TaxID=1682393 RepID=A0A9P8YG84_9PEZI|nr:uncharacterized protein B0I36DRAFT_78036 [Microdochium trichocladiopsis]KAH7038312.1 hypothetical protein B0I36DRAFT_78036 [Microdochium trichocladiopsis]